MELKIKNGQLEMFYGLLVKTTFKNMKANRGRVKLLKRVEEKYQEFINDEKDILKEYAVVDEKGELKEKDGKYQLKEGVNEYELAELRVELINEKVLIAGGEYSNRFNDYFKALEDYNEELEIDELTLVDNLLEQYEQQLGGQK